MGYYTYYELGIHKRREDVDCVSIDDDIDTNVVAAIANRLDCLIDGVNTSNKHNIEDVLFDSLKWYDHDSDMETISKEYPDLYFTLYGDGEESDDFWRKLYHDGKKIAEVNVEMIFPPLL